MDRGEPRACPRRPTDKIICTHTDSKGHPDLTDTAAPATAFALVPDHVSDAGRYIQAAADNLTQGMRSASAEVDALASTWRGVAASTYAAAWTEAATAAAHVFDALADMAELLGVTVDRAAAVDAYSASGYTSLDLP